MLKEVSCSVSIMCINNGNKSAVDRVIKASAPLSC